MNEQVLHVSKIKEGTVIDHITNGHALDVVKILGIKGKGSKVVTIAINVPSKRFNRKDIIKIEGREFDTQEVHKIALLAPHATINIIRDYEAEEKQRVKLPNVVDNIIKCANPACVSNSNEPVSTKFYVDRRDPLLLKCHYCGRIMEKNDVLQQF